MIVVSKHPDNTRINVVSDVEIYMDCTGLLGPGSSAQTVYFVQTVDPAEDTELVTSGVG